MIGTDMDVEKLFRTKYLTTRSALLSAIEYAVEQAESRAQATPGPDALFYKAKAKLFRTFSEKVHATPLFEKLEIGWRYVFTIGSRGATLHVCHNAPGVVQFGLDQFEMVIEDCDAVFDLIKTEARLLTSEEYAMRCGVSSDTIRMWIRRGKIRSAVKLGNTWKIPEVAEPITRGFKDATYEWHSRIEDAPDRFRFLSDPGSLLIRRIRSKELPFELTLRDLCGEPIDEQRLTSAETEKLEAFLIATPEVIYTGDLEYFSECKEES